MRRIGLMLAVLMLVGCTKQPPAAPVQAVEDYLGGLPTALNAETLDGIRPYATDEQLDKVARYVGMYLGEGKRVAATLTELKVTDGEVLGSSATVDTTERWSFEYRDKDSGETIGREAYALDMKYHLVLQDGTWRVSDVEEVNRRESR